MARIWIFSVFYAAALAGGQAQAQPVVGDVRALGFEANVAARNVYREGAWLPIMIELTGQSSEHQQVELRCASVDLDGDRIGYVSGPVAVTAGGGLTRAWCYAVPGGDLAGNFVVELRDRAGALLQQLAPAMGERISPDTLLVVDLSRSPLTALRSVDTGPSSYSDAYWDGGPYYQAVCVATLAARALPDRWFGLEAAQIIVWDEPQLDGIENAQIAALREWVRGGGTLIVGLGPTWNTLQESSMAEFLPLARGGAVVQIRRLRRLAERYGSDEAGDRAAPLPVVAGALAPGARALVEERLPDGRLIPLLSRREFGSGVVIASAARLSDLMPERGPGADPQEVAPLRARSFFADLIGLPPLPVKFATDDAAQWMGPTLGYVPLYAPLVAPIEFRSQAGALLAVAIVFVAGYILLAAVASWFWLRRRGQTSASWSVFAAFAVVASAVSLAAVGLVRGVRSSVHSVAFVDVEAGSTDARAFTLYGFKSSRRQRVDLSLNGDESFLRPLAPAGRLESNAAYATPLSYAAQVGRALLQGAPLRATLKQFEGLWRGPLVATVRGQLTADRRSGRITPESWIQSDLPLDFDRGYLLYIDPRLRDADGNVPQSIHARTEWIAGRKYWTFERVPPAVNVLALALPRLASGQPLRELGRDTYVANDLALQQWLVRAPGAEHDRTEPMLPTLWYCQVEEWMARSLAPSLTRLAPLLPSEQAAALLASTRRLYLHGRYSDGAVDFDVPGTPVSALGLPDLDVTRWLTRGQALLILIASQPGPAPLLSGGSPLRTPRGLSVYRVRMPIDYRGSPPVTTQPAAPRPEEAP